MNSIQITWVLIVKISSGLKMEKNLCSSFKENIPVVRMRDPTNLSTPRQDGPHGSRDGQYAHLLFYSKMP